jgi:hypothetical protein
MIKNKELKVKIAGPNIKYYRDKGLNIKNGEIINIPIDLINPNSHIKITAICDLCQKENLVSIKNYNYQTKDNKKYTCHKCSIIKAKKTKKIRYGNENFNNREKAQKTIFEKYNVDHISKIPGHYNKVIKTMNEKYGMHFSKTAEFKEKFKKSMNDNFGVDYPMESDIIRKKSENTLMNKYGVHNISQLKSNFEKIKKSSLNIKKYRDSNIYYQGSFELDFLEKFYNKIEISNAPSIKYNLNKSDHIYFPDFYIKSYNLIIEIKSSYFYNRDYKIIKEKEKFVINSGFNYLLILDKNYEEFIKTIE